jgi:hypothetical protein
MAPSPAVPRSPPPLPAVSPMLSFSAGGVIGRSFSVWLRNFLPFSLVTLVVYVPVFALVAAVPEGGSGWDLVTRLLSALADLVISGALTFGVLESLRGGRASVGALFRKGFGKMGTVFVVSFRTGLWLVLGTILLVVPAIVWYCALFVAVPAAVVEDRLASSADALARSRALTKGHRWGIFAVMLVVFAVTVVGTLVAGVVLSLLGAVVAAWAQVLLVTALIALLSSLGASAHAVAYHDLRVEKEGVATDDLVKVFE